MYNIQSMFHSATIRLTVWYLAGIMTLSIMFSLLIYSLSMNELTAKIGALHARLEASNIAIPRDVDLGELRNRQEDDAARTSLMTLLYTNLAILGLASVISYMGARRTLQPIEEAHQAQARFTSDASHELRTPLTAIRTEIEVALYDRQATKQDYRTVLTSMLDEIKRLSALSNSLLKLARMEDDDINHITITLQDALASALSALARDPDEIIVTKPQRPMIIHGNYEMITELMIILIDNALKYRTPGTPVRVRLMRRNHRACLEVSNTGAGISKEDMPHIFGRFYRAETSGTNSTKSGYGLGLALAHKIVNLHYGDITVYSTPGKTTSFTARLPLG